MLKNNYTCLLLSFLLLSLLFSCRTSHNVTTANSEEVAKLSQRLKIPIAKNDKNLPLYSESAKWLGVPYRYGGNTKAGVDCSGFVKQVLDKTQGTKLERTTTQMYKRNIKKLGKGSLKTGDLVFFKVSKRAKNVDHVGIFLRDGNFIHASSTRGVMVSSLDEPFYKKHWKKGGRVK